MTTNHKDFTKLAIKTTSNDCGGASKLELQLPFPSSPSAILDVVLLEHLRLRTVKCKTGANVSQLVRYTFGNMASSSIDRLANVLQLAVAGLVSL